MMTETVKVESHLSTTSTSSSTTPAAKKDVRHYVVMPRFVTSAATSLEKFANQVLQISNTLPDLNNRIHIQTYHPEHVHEAKRSPLPILMLQWKYDDDATATETTKDEETSD
jgi:hypothetical protein